MKMKEHIHREMVNELREIAKLYHGAEQLRERIAWCVGGAFERNEKWYADHPNEDPTSARTIELVILRLLMSVREKILDQKVSSAAEERAYWKAFDFMLDALDQFKGEINASLPSTVAGGETKDEGAQKSKFGWFIR